MRINELFINFLLKNKGKIFLFAFLLLGFFTFLSAFYSTVKEVKNINDIRLEFDAISYEEAKSIEFSAENRRSQKINLSFVRRMDAFVFPGLHVKSFSMSMDAGLFEKLRGFHLNIGLFNQFFTKKNLNDSFDLQQTDHRVILKTKPSLQKTSLIPFCNNIITWKGDFWFLRELVKTCVFSFARNLVLIGLFLLSCFVLSLPWTFRSALHWIRRFPYTLLKTLVFRIACLLLVWQTLFFLIRFLFFVYFHERYQDFSFWNIIHSFWNGFWIDLSTAGYLIALPILSLCLAQVFPYLKGLANRKLLLTYHIAMVVIVMFLTAFDLAVYEILGWRINYNLFIELLLTPGTTTQSAGGNFWLYALVFVVLTSLGAVMMIFVTKSQTPVVNIAFSYRIVLACTMMVATFFLIRGSLWGERLGLRTVALPQAQLNSLVVNTTWLFIQNGAEKIFGLKEKHIYRTSFQYFPQQEAEQIVQRLYSPTDDRRKVTQILNQKKPNIIVLLMESFGSEFIKSLDYKGDDGLTTFTDQELVKNGLLFSNIYATGSLSEVGAVGTLSGFPSQASHKILSDNPQKSLSLAFIPRQLRPAGYISYHAEGQTNPHSSNLHIYFSKQNDRYQSVVTSHDFAPETERVVWGIYDHFVFTRQLQELEKAPWPFFSSLTTIVLHPPHDVAERFRAPKTFSLNRRTEWIKHAVYYTDASLRDYFQVAKTKPWYKNTLFILLADHGPHNSLRDQQELFYPDRYRIPLIFYGEVLKPEFRGQVIKKVGSQIDLAKTLLFQLGQDASAFEFSKNLLDPRTPEFAFFSSENYCGMIKPARSMTIDTITGSVVFNSNPTSSQSNAETMHEIQAMIQVIMDRVNKLKSP